MADFVKVCLELFEIEWSQIGKNSKYPDAFENDFQKKQMYNESKQFVKHFAIMNAVQLDGINLESKSKLKDEFYEQNIKKHIRPHEREIYLQSKDKKFRGYADKILKIWDTEDGETGSIIYDYKTSKQEKPHSFKREHLIQLSSYAVLELARGGLPVAGVIVFLRTAQSVFYYFKPEDITMIENMILEITSKGEKMEEYPCKINGLCRKGYCDFCTRCKSEAPEVWDYDGKQEKSKRQDKRKDSNPAKPT